MTDKKESFLNKVSSRNTEDGVLLTSEEIAQSKRNHKRTIKVLQEALETYKNNKASE